MIGDHDAAPLESSDLVRAEAEVGQDLAGVLAGARRLAAQPRVSGRRA